MKMGNTQGFTLVEMLTTIGIFTAMVCLTVPTYDTLKNNVALNNDAKEVVGALKVAQSESIASQEGVTHGVHFVSGSDSYIAFAGTWPSPVSQTEYHLKRGITFYSADTTITFDRLTGSAEPATAVIGTSATNKVSIQVEKSGNIFIE